MKLLQCTDRNAVYVCADKKCKFYEFPEPEAKWIVVKRSFEKAYFEELKAEHAKKAAKSVDKLGPDELEQFVNDTYCKYFKNSNTEVSINESEVNNDGSINNNDGGNVIINKEKTVEPSNNCDAVEFTDQQISEILDNIFESFETKNAMLFTNQFEVSNNDENSDVDKEKKIESSNNLDSVKALSEELDQLIDNNQYYENFQSSNDESFVNEFEVSNERYINNNDDDDDGSVDINKENKVEWNNNYNLDKSGDEELYLLINGRYYETFKRSDFECDKCGTSKKYYNNNNDDGNVNVNKEKKVELDNNYNPAKSIDEELNQAINEKLPNIDVKLIESEIRNEFCNNNNNDDGNVDINKEIKVEFDDNYNPAKSTDEELNQPINEMYYEEFQSIDVKLNESEINNEYHINNYFDGNVDIKTEKKMESSNNYNPPTSADEELDQLMNDIYYYENVGNNNINFFIDESEASNNNGNGFEQ
ncbi:hypothetical protein ILUMI_22999 [Ignelater luminosus]|uniref:Uncharacterized protein n=1 Tax=Ignelater luminosus TaxID=2038154 RepID=A0A8K0G008_IGNLU|nr:hypothetical protein ILUMI_22999 [Ignelater luminosus]